MADLDWTRLAPHRPVQLDATTYVLRPESGADRLAALIKAGANPIAVAGPVGIGKSSELVIASIMLRPDRFPLIAPVDHLLADAQEKMLAPQLAHADILTICCGMASAAAQLANLQLSRALQQDLFNAGLQTGLPGLQKTGEAKHREDLLRELIRECGRASGKPVALFVDGLEKCTTDEARRALDALLPFRGEATLVVVVPTELANGPAGHATISNFKLFPIRPVAVREEAGARWREGRDFLKSIVWRRMELEPPGPEGLAAVLERAAEASGGVPRPFLQLVQDAGTYARLAGRVVPTMDDLTEAMSEHAESLRRLLLKGDVAALREADGTDGLEVDPERRLRFLAHGLLLEYKLADRIVVHPAPLLAGILGREAAA